ncbi:MAG: hypothetical protein ACRDT6_28835, partial [Micromonosporaceae bacterium]
MTLASFAAATGGTLTDYLHDVVTAVHPPPYRLTPGRHPVAYEYRLLRERLVLPAERGVAAAALRGLARSRAARL